MKNKESTEPLGIKPEILLAIMIVAVYYQQRQLPLTLTSLTDGKHSKTSRHPLGLAVDIRTRDLPPNIQVVDVAKDLKARLGPHYNLIVHETHIHIAFRPV